MNKTREFSTQVAQRIKRLREANGLSIRELARRSELPPESVSRSERGITGITIKNLSKLCRGLRVDLPSFFDFAKSPIKSPGSRPEIRRVTGLLAGLPEKRLRDIVRAVELMVRSQRK